MTEKDTGNAKRQEFMEKWGITEEDVCLYAEDDADFMTGEEAEAVFDE